MITTSPRSMVSQGYPINEFITVQLDKYEHEMRATRHELTFDWNIARHDIDYMTGY